MFFESGIYSPAECAESLQTAAAQFESGETFAASQSAERLLLNGNGFTDCDWVFLADLTRMCGQFRRSDAVILLARKQHPESWLLRLIHGWDLAANAKSFAAIKVLNQLKKDIPAQHLPLIHAISALNYSQIDWQESATKQHDLARREVSNRRAEDDATVWYILSRASARRTKWEQAIEEGERALELAPQWQRARSTLIDSLLSQGRIEETNQIIAEGQQYPLRDVRMDFVIAMQREASRRIDAAIEALHALIARWPARSDIHKYSVRQLALLLMTNGRADEARRLLEEHKIKEFIDHDKVAGADRCQFISIPLISQAYNHCVPTTAAMVAGAQGVAADPRIYAQAMLSRHGTPLWRMVDYMTSLEFQAECVDARPEVIENMLDYGIPLIGSLQGFFSSHVEVLCGYDSALQLVHIRDPMHWHSGAATYEGLPNRYAESPGLWAFIAPSKIAATQIPDSWKSPVGQAQVNLSRAISQGDRLAAEAAYALIPDDHPAAYMRDSTARSVVITPKRYQENLDKYVKDDQGSPLAQMRAMLQMVDPDNAQQVLDLAESCREKFGKFFVEYVRVTCQMARYEWQAAMKTLWRLAQKWPGIDQLWGQLAIVQSELGLREEAMKSLKRAMEISPEAEWLHHRALGERVDELPYQQRVDLARKLVDDYPDSPSTRWGLANVLREAPRGLDFEEALRNVSRFFPRDPWPFEQLADWFLQQDRVDLATAILQQGRELIGTDELPIKTYEESETTSDKDGEAAKDDAVAEDSAATNDSVAAAPQSIAHEPETGRQSDSAVADVEGSAAVAGEAAAMSDEPLLSKEQCIEVLLREINGLDHTSFEQLKELQFMLDLNQKHQLWWWESARLVSLRIINLMKDASGAFQKPAARAERLRQILPETHLPGVVESYVLAVISGADSGSMPPACVTVLLDWARRHVPDAVQFPGLLFELAFLIERSGHLNEAEKSLRTLIEKYPAYSPAWFRLGQISSTRGEIEAAKNCFHKSLEISPGHFGSMFELADLAAYETPQEVAVYRRRLADLFPYSQKYVYEAAYAVNQAEGNEAALQYLDSSAQCFADGRSELIKARLLADIGQSRKALDLLEEHQLVQRHAYPAMWIQVDCYLNEEQTDRAIQLLRKMAERWPENYDVIEQLARSLYQLEPRQARDYAGEELAKGRALTILAQICLKDLDNADETAKQIVQAARAEDRDSITLVCSEALETNPKFDCLMNFLSWCNEEFPHLTGLREQLAVRFDMLGNSKRAKEIAKDLYDNEPNHPRWLALMGRCTQDDDPRESLKYLQKEYDLTGNSDTLCRMGRAYQLLGETDRAIEHYWQTLEKNPFDCLAMSNLMYKYEDHSQRIWELTNKAIEFGFGTNDQYFHVCTVNLALARRAQLPASWIQSAIRRLKIVRSEGGFRDEEQRLQRAIYIWLLAWGEKQEAKQYGNLWQWFPARFNWPKTSWIPRKPA